MSGRNQTLFICEPSPVMAEALATRLGEAGFSVVGQSSDYEQAVEIVSRLNVDIVICGVDSPAGAEAALLRRAHQGGAKTVVFGSTTQLLDAVFSAGADVFVMRSAPLDDLLLALDQVSRQTIFFPARAARHSVAHDLTRRELEILRLASEGYKNEAIGDILEVAEQTVKFHLTNIFRKIGVSNRTQAASWARERGL